MTNLKSENCLRQLGIRIGNKVFYLPDVWLYPTFNDLISFREISINFTLKLFLYFSNYIFN